MDENIGFNLGYEEDGREQFDFILGSFEKSLEDQDRDLDLYLKKITLLKSSLQIRRKKLLKAIRKESSGNKIIYDPLYVIYGVLLGVTGWFVIGKYFVLKYEGSVGAYASVLIILGAYALVFIAFHMLRSLWQKIISRDLRKYVYTLVAIVVVIGLVAQSFSNFMILIIAGVMCVLSSAICLRLYLDFSSISVLKRESDQLLLKIQALIELEEEEVRKFFMMREELEKKKQVFIESYIVGRSKK